MEEKVQLENAEYALGYGIKVIIISGITTTLISFVTILGYLNEPTQLGPNLAVAILTLLYGIVLSFILLIIKARVHKRINE